MTDDNLQLTADVEALIGAWSDRGADAVACGLLLMAAGARVLRRVPLRRDEVIELLERDMATDVGAPPEPVREASALPDTNPETPRSRGDA